MIAARELAPPRQLDRDDPWPGLDPFEESSRDYFHGREAEGEELARRVADAPLTVLFGKSGLGKTSLLQAGLFPRLRERGFFPVYARLDVRPDAPPLAEQLARTLRVACQREEVDAPAPRPQEPLWEYLHRHDLELWSRDNRPLTPVLVLDQFEELFTLGERLPEAVERFRLELGDLAENRIPAGLELAADAAERLDVRSMRYKLLVSLREDFLPHLEGWRRSIPSLGRARVRLLPLGEEQALAAVFRSAAHLMDEAVARRIVRFVAAEERAAGQGEPGQATVDPALLSLFCRGLNERRKRAGLARIDERLLDGAQQGIVSDYYRSCVGALPPRVAEFIEGELITEKGFRNSFARDDAVPARLTEDELAGLIRRRLLRVEERYGTQRIELTHDVLTRTVRQHRDGRRAEEERAALAQRVEDEKAALAAQARAREEELVAGRRAEEERRLRFEAAAGRRFERLALGLAAALVVVAMMAAAAYYQRKRAAAEAEAARAAERNAQALAEEAHALARQAVDAAQLAENRRQVAETRVAHMLDAIRLKQAVGAADRERIAAFLGSPLANRTVRFTARAEPRGKVGGQARFLYSLAPDLATLPGGGKDLGLVTYWMDHESFSNAVMTSGRDRAFTSTYYGWGCLDRVVALLEYTDPDHAPEIAEFDMCAALP